MHTHERETELPRKFMLVVSLALLIMGNPVFADEKVSFFSDMVSEIDGRYMELLGGSAWLLDHEIATVPFDDGIIVFPGHDISVNEKDIKKRIRNLPKQGVLFYDGIEVVVTLIDGFFVRENGTLTNVEKSMGGGALLETSDGSLWSVPSYDRYDSGYWRPPYKVIVHSNELYMTNLKKGKKIWVSRVEK